MKRIKIISVGKLKSVHWRAAADHYRKRLKPYLDLEETQIKDADPCLPTQERVEREGERLLKLIAACGPQAHMICLDEKGKNMDSAAFAFFLRELHDSGYSPCFIVGGPFGLSKRVLAQAQTKLRLSSLTFTHEMALVLLLEQVYRAENINAGTGYHH